MFIKRILFAICSLGLMTPTASVAHPHSIAQSMFEPCFPFCDRALDTPDVWDVKPQLPQKLENKLRLKFDRPSINTNANEEKMDTFQTNSSSSSSSVSSSSSSVSSGTHTINGQTIHYDLRGNQQASSTIRTESNILVLTAQVDQNQHIIKVHPDKIVHNGVSAPINGFRQVDIVIESESVAIAVDGQQVFP